MELRPILLKTKYILSGSGLITSNGKWFFRDNEFGCFTTNDEAVIQHHIHLVSEAAKIKEGDWCYSKVSNKIIKASYMFNAFELVFCSKLICSTDKPLNVSKMTSSAIRELINHYDIHGKMPNRVDAYNISPSLPLEIILEDSQNIENCKERVYREDDVKALFHELADYIMPNTIEDHAQYSKWIKIKLNNLIV